MRSGVHLEFTYRLFLKVVDTYVRAVARYENPGGLVVLGGDIVPPLVEIGLTDVPKTGVAPPRLRQACLHF